MAEPDFTDDEKLQLRTRLKEDYLKTTEIQRLRNNFEASDNAKNWVETVILPWIKARWPHAVTSLLTAAAVYFGTLFWLPPEPVKTPEPPKVEKRKDLPPPPLELLR